MINLGLITHNIQNSKKISVTKINVNKKFLQTESIPVLKTKHEVNIPKSNFVVNEIIELPKYYCTFLDNNNYYLYGSPNLFNSILFITDDNFRLGSVNKKNELENFKETLIKEYNKNYMKHKLEYAKLNIKKNKLETYIKELNFEKEITPYHGIFQIISDIKKVNILILNNEKNLYECYESLEESDNNIILVIIDNKIVSLLNIYGKLFTNDEIKTIKTYFKCKLVLNKINSYKLNDLQLLANNNNISITINGKNKQKKQLYEELLLLT